MVRVEINDIVSVTFAFVINPKSGLLKTSIILIILQPDQPRK